MKQLKFRAYDHIDKLMFNVESIHYRPDDSIYVKSFGGLQINVQEGVCDLLQSIGKEDKNGVMIFGGDVLDLHQTVNGVSLFSVFYDHEKVRFSIKYHTDRMNHRSRDYEYSVTEFFQSSDLLDDVDYEVIGNIYQNPELLKEK